MRSVILLGLPISVRCLIRRLLAIGVVLAVISLFAVVVLTGFVAVVVVVAVVVAAVPVGVTLV